MIEILLAFIVILLGTKLAAHLCQLINIPSVIGELLVGILLGPAMLNLVHPSQTMEIFSQIGVIFLMFLAGLESDFHLLRKYMKPSVVIACLGVILPMILFFIVGNVFHMPTMEAVFLGIVFAATSVSISVQVLREYNHLDSKDGSIILGSAVVDDIMVVMIVSIFTTILDQKGSFSFNLAFLWDMIGGKLLFFLVAFLFAKYLLLPLLRIAKRLYATEAVTAFSLALCFAFALLSEELGMSDVIGAFFVGLMISLTEHQKVVQEKIDVIGYSLFIPIFFVSIGLNVRFDGFIKNLPFILILTVLGVLSKLIGGYIGGRFSHLTSRQSFVVGAGMVSRGEMALIIVQMGVRYHLISDNMYSEIIMAIILTTLISPFLIKGALAKEKEELIEG
ncbi:cation:proton antiporter [Catellicoccus marimammalium]|uniref:Na+/H+ antiporter n=1 Tax=Catellicoccus marimammalium M35/04/3 TaxID=1234409 RepID=K8ZM36_9ENTE|nr:cation:proton antiporter [Catellicoccus marimammalium]EKU27563.1 Na+/H+ antiporter [Catellicoccus marimammalium M35/04/3]